MKEFRKIILDMITQAKIIYINLYFQMIGNIIYKLQKTVLINKSYGTIKRIYIGTFD